jgi:hypothetical protein
MRKSLAINGLRASAFALATLALSGSWARAGTDTSSMTATTSTVTTTTTMSSPVESYSTVGSIGTTGVTNSNGDTGPGPIGFNQLTTGSFGLNSAISLGSFAVSTLTDGSTTTYNNTPFTIVYNPVSISGPNASVDKFPHSPITITGVFNGSVNGNQSSVQATFDQVKNSVFTTSDGTYMSTINVANNPLTLVPSTSGGGLTTIQAVVTTTAQVQPPSGGTGGSQTAPEPTTMAILATSLVGLGLRKKLGSARKPA